MSYRAWLFVIALGLGASAASSQNGDDQPPHPQPESTQDQAADQASIEAPQVVQISGPTDSTSAEHDSAGTQNGNEEPHQNSTLILGDGLAQWLMAFSGLIALGLSGWAVWLLHKTLRTTEDTLKEAGNATDVARRSLIATRAGIKLQLKEARNATVAAREVGQAQMRAYVRIVSGSVRLERGKPGMTDQRIRPIITMRVKNYGQSPAKWFRDAMIVRYSPPFLNRFLGHLIPPPKSWGSDIGPSEEISIQSNHGTAVFPDDVSKIFQSNELHLDIVIRFVFEDVFGVEVEDERVFMCYFQPGMLNVDVQMKPHVFDRGTIEDIVADANRLTGSNHTEDQDR